MLCHAWRLNDLVFSVLDALGSQDLCFRVHYLGAESYSWPDAGHYAINLGVIASLFVFTLHLQCSRLPIANALVLDPWPASDSSRGRCVRKLVALGLLLRLSSSRLHHCLGLSYRNGWALASRTMMTWKMLPYFLFRLGFGRGLFTVHDVAALGKEYVLLFVGSYR